MKSTWTLPEQIEVLKTLDDISTLKEFSIEQLQDISVVEALVKKAGLHRSGGDGGFESEEYEWPRELLSNSRSGN
jgi:hypothetical protein